MKLKRLLKDIEGGLVMKNEKGYALILVLLIITISFIFALSMSGMALSARKQFNKTDEVNKATDLAEMGIAHFEAIVSRQVVAANAAAKAQVDTALEASLKWPNKGYTIPDYDEVFYDTLASGVLNNNYPNLKIEGSNTYKVSSPSLTKLQNHKIAVTFKSEGKTKYEAELLESTIFVEKINDDSRVGDAVPNKDSFKILEMNPFELIGGKENEIYPGSTFFTKSVTLKGNTTLKIDGDAFFNSDVTLKGGDKIYVMGDAFFTTHLNKHSVNGNSSICVLGKAYFVENNNVLDYTDFYGGDTSDCPAPINNIWSIDPINGVEVKY
jgi:hypothetical protein